MMLASEHPDDVGFGMDLTEMGLNWMETEDGAKLPRNSTLEDLGIHQHQTLVIAHKAPAVDAPAEEEEQSEAPTKAARYTSHIFKDDGADNNERGIYGVATINVEVFDHPRLDLLGAQPHYGMQFTKMQEKLDRTCPSEVHHIQVHLDQKVGGIIERIRLNAGIPDDSDIFLFHGEGKHEDEDPDRHLEGDDTRISFWTRGEMLQECWADHIHEYGPNFVAVSKEADGVVPYHGRWVDRMEYDSDELEHHGTSGSHGSTFGKKFKHIKNLDADGDGVVGANEFHAAGKHHSDSHRASNSTHKSDLKHTAASRHAHNLATKDESGDGVLDAWER